VLAGLSPARRRLIVAVAALVVVALAALAAVLVSRATAPAAEPVSQERPGPVLVVPGYGGGTASLQPLADRLTAAGRDVTVIAIPGTGTGDLALAADALAAAAEAVLARTGAESVDVIGYSAGGVVARLWIADDGAAVVRRVVTLGSPHHGTTLADLAGDVAPRHCPLGCQQLGTDSDVLARLNAEDETPEGPTWVSIWTTQDRTVTPPESARLDGALNLPVQSVCAQARLGHGQLPRDPVVIEMVLAQLAPGEPVPLDAADCARLGG
jgi:triacylglycerol esterase/lipase EstA (alpha/beta hydrolase family)